MLAALERLTKHPALHWLPTLRRIGADNLRTLEADWDTWALPGQRVAGDWRVWLIRAGRGFGKTRAGAEWISEIARTTPDARIALVGATASEARQVMVEGESGLLACKRHGEATCWKRDQGLLLFGSGAQAQVFSAEAPESLRGAQHHVAWCDEIAKWRYGEAAWDNLMLGLRLGTHPRVVVTTTPRPNNLMRRIMTTKGVTLTTGRTRDNFHLPAVFVEAMEDAYGGTAKGRQELDGEMIEEADGALWSRALIERARVDGHPELARIVVGVDPPATAEGDACGIVCVGLGADGRGYVLEDASVGGLTPEGWAAAVASCAERWGADRVVAETNQGGEMVASVLRGADRALPVKPVHASRSKTARAEPVMTWYASGRVFHAGRFPALEDELCGLRVGGAYEGPGRSPDRADACVWALTELLGKPAAAPAVRTL
ncbi:DNA-packaging protein [uncultured Sphingomonas sp.]|uniref:DNA-packaging protein n=1 Tax=uncultured Sphingomonas sp. TaxID=158754 RepID=UPI0035CC739D